MVTLRKEVTIWFQVGQGSVAVASGVYSPTSCPVNCGRSHWHVADDVGFSASVDRIKLDGDVKS